MPKIVKKITSVNEAKSVKEGFLNMAKVTAAAFGTDYKQTVGNDRQYYVPTDSIGYPGFCVAYTWGGGDVIYSGIQKTKSDGTIDTSDRDVAAVASMPLTTNVLLPFNVFTCVLFHDSKKDTVSFSIIPCGYEDGHDNTESNICRVATKAFFAKDVKENVLCGIGKTQIHYLRTFDNSFQFALKDQGGLPDNDVNVLPNFLHLTKMINYLSPEHPEMKSAYISVTRPNNGYMNESYYAENARWGFAGYYKPEPPQDITGATVYKISISPWVKY